jgi:hypothetical protein
MLVLAQWRGRVRVARVPEWGVGPCLACKQQTDRRVTHTLLSLCGLAYSFVHRQVATPRSVERLRAVYPRDTSSTVLTQAGFCTWQNPCVSMSCVFVARPPPRSLSHPRGCTDPLRPSLFSPSFNMTSTVTILHHSPTPTTTATTLGHRAVVAHAGAVEAPGLRAAHRRRGGRCPRCVARLLDYSACSSASVC